ncbi:FdhD protein [Methanomicrobium sp. W14]|uniref:formate dehydrogenase accessory sulfurtransferase FdhD n=1 Tax=Methanomicrobium sp. W14 TaxID=2817839 RepID=UPI001AEA4A21|nr:formate dehydrogenase accessory sulfurtransferase FdhD [Methanomicrobium sp. W14]MBP2132371.1 FdhD protein [Methanomicrobium sp. W14]
MYTKRHCIRGGVSGYEESFADVVSESPVGIFVNGRQAATVMLSPAMLKEYAAGFLLTEGIVKSPDEIESVLVEDNKISVLMQNPRKMLFSKKTVLSGCGGGATSLDYSRIPAAPKGKIFPPETIKKAAKEVYARKSPVKADSLFSAGIFSDGKTVCIAQDIGRDNALDKAVGDVFLEKISLPGCFAVVTGRISSETVRKCLYAQIPFAVSLGGVTSLACDAAQEKDMTVIYFDGGEVFSIFSGEKRVAGIR